MGVKKTHAPVGVLIVQHPRGVPRAQAMSGVLLPHAIVKRAIKPQNIDAPPAIGAAAQTVRQDAPNAKPAPTAPRAAYRTTHAAIPVATPIQALIHRAAIQLSIMVFVAGLKKLLEYVQDLEAKK